MKKKFGAFLRLNPFLITFYITVIIFFLLISKNPFLHLAELKTIDLRFRYRGERKPHSPVVMAVIDDKSLDREGKWPWPRAKIGELIDRLSEDGAKVVAFDVFFSEPDNNNNLQFIRQFDQKVKELQLKSKSLAKLIEESRIKADNDRALADAIKRSKAKVVLGFPFHQGKEEFQYETSPQELANRLRQVENAEYPLIRYRSFEKTGYANIPLMDVPLPNIEVLSQASHASGYIHMQPEDDGVIRSLPMVFNVTLHGKAHLFMPLSIQALRQYLDQPPLMLIISEYGVENIRMGDFSIPTTISANMYINFLGPDKAFPYFSITDILHGRVAKGTFQDKIVIVGSSALGAHDLRVTPFSINCPGMEIHANVIDNILNRRFLSQFSIYLVGPIILFISLLTWLVIPRLTAIKGLLSALGFFIVYILLLQWLFNQYGLLLNMMYPTLTLFLVYTSLTAYHFFTVERDRKKIKNAFVCYVSRSVVNEILKSPEKLKLGGDQKELSVLFSDIRDFTTMAEGMTPGQLVPLLNEYLTLMTDIIFRYDGTLDKYIGDAIMAFYGAPLEQSDHPLRACHTALEMTKELRKLNEKWIKEGRKPLRIGIGINTGQMTVGNMGSEQRFDYTVIGDAVNLGSRLEAANKTYNSNILISETTYLKVKETFTCLELDQVRVKGKTQPVKIYQLIDTLDIPSTLKQALAEYHQGLELFRRRRWEEASVYFQKTLSQAQALYAAELYLKRAAQYQADPPPADWDASITMTVK